LHKISSLNQAQLAISHNQGQIMIVSGDEHHDAGKEAEHTPMKKINKF
jgi:hypothetical protein